MKCWHIRGMAYLMIWLPIVILPLALAYDRMCLDEYQENYVGPCVAGLHCLAAEERGCNSTDDIVIGNQSCVYQSYMGSGVSVHRAGCQLLCQAQQVKEDCCPGFYSPQCLACPGNGFVCSGKGTCSDGVNGNGQCSCWIGFSGSSCQYCDSDLTRCQSLVRCSYSHGGCHANATCYQDQGSVRCECAVGYRGDGVNTCDPINLCAENHWCNSSSEVCISTGPGQIECVCREGYQGNPVTGCSPVNHCSADRRVRCHPLATCVSLTFGYECVCPKHYVQDGLNCYGSILKELSHPNLVWPTLIADQSEAIHTSDNLTEPRFHLIISLLESLFPETDAFDDTTQLTFLAPTDESLLEYFGGMDQMSRMIHSESTRLKSFLANHFIGGSFTSEGLAHSLVYSSAGNVLNSTRYNGTKIVECTAAGSAAVVKVVASDWTTSTGFIHVVSGLLACPAAITNVENSSNLDALSRLQQIHNFSEFYSLLKSHSDSKIFGHLLRNYTIFVPLNGHWGRQYSKENKEFLENPIGADRLQHILRGHIVAGRYTLLDLWRDTNLINVNGHPISIKLTNQSLTTVNGSLLQYPDILAQNVVMHGIDGFLIHDEHINSNIGKCPEPRKQLFNGLCAACHDHTSASCPSAQDAVVSVSYCQLANGSQGCSVLCERTIIRETCCEHFVQEGYCMLCPGGVFNECNGRGQCTNDGCVCEPPYGGVDCMECRDTAKYGPTCSLNCTCDSGSELVRCGARVDSIDGHCTLPCPSHQFGPDCDQYLAGCSDGTHLLCHVSAVCSLWPQKRCACPGSLVMSESGKCKAMCGGADGRGPCHKYAECRTSRLPYMEGTPFRNHTSQCQCTSGYQGDGYFCEYVKKCSQDDHCQPRSTGKCNYKHTCGCKNKLHMYRHRYRCTQLPCTADPGLCPAHMRCVDWYLGGPYHECQCRVGYEEYPSGVCFTNAQQELMDRNYTTMSTFIQSDPILSELTLRQRANITVLYLSNAVLSAFKEALTLMGLMDLNGYIHSALRFHVLRGIWNISELCEINSTFQTMFGETVQLTCHNRRSTFYAHGGHGPPSHVTRSAVRATNGNLVGVSSVLLSPYSLVTRPINVLPSQDYPESTEREFVFLWNQLKEISPGSMPHLHAQNLRGGYTVILPQTSGTGSHALEDWLRNRNLSNFLVSEAVDVGQLSVGSKRQSSTLSGRTLIFSCAMEQGIETYLINMKVKILKSLHGSHGYIYITNSTDIPSLYSGAPISSAMGSFFCGTVCFASVLVASSSIFLFMSVTLIVCMCRSTSQGKAHRVRSGAKYEVFTRNTSVSEEEQRTERESQIINAAKIPARAARLTSSSSVLTSTSAVTSSSAASSGIPSRSRLSSARTPPQSPIENLVVTEWHTNV